MSLVFPAFKKRPDVFPNMLMVLTVSSNEFLLPSSVISVSSAYCDFFLFSFSYKNTFYNLILSEHNGKYLYT